MAETESKLEAGRRLARDLRSIRRSRSIDIKEVLDATRLAEDIIEQLEDTALMGNPMFNRVYLRSILGSYAAVLGVSHADIMSALDDALLGNYVGSLAKKYLGEQSENLELPISKQGEDVDPTSAAVESVENESVSDLEQESGEELVTDDKKSKKGKGKGEDSTDLKTAINPVTDKERPAPESSTVKTNETEHSNTLQQPLSQVFKLPAVISKSVTTKARVLLPNMSGFLMLVFAVLSLISLLWFATSWILSPKSVIEEEGLVPDSTQLVIQNLPQRIVLGNSIEIKLIAYMEALDPIRVQIDRDLRQPYWVEHLDTLTFEMTDSVEFEREVDHARILISEFVIPSSWYASSIRAQITRDQTQAWLDSLTQVGKYPPRTFGVE
jgi:hypothetical protein